MAADVSALQSGVWTTPAEAEKPAAISIWVVAKGRAPLTAMPAVLGPRVPHRGGSLQAQDLFDQTKRTLHGLPLIPTAYRVGRNVLRIAVDDERMDQHFRVRLSPFLTAAGGTEPATWVVALSRPDHTRACGLAEVSAYEELDAIWVDVIRPRQCVAAVSAPDRLVMLGFLAAGGDMYWLAGFMTEMICGLALGASAVVLHASAVATPWGGVVCVGGGGSGKTTLALALSRTPGCTFVADDTALLSVDDCGVVRLLPLFGDVHLAPSTFQLIPGLAACKDEGARGFDITGMLLAQDPLQAEKFRIHAADVSPAWHSVSVPLRAVVFPAIAWHSRSSILSVPPTELGWAKLTSGVQPFLTDHWPGTIERQRGILQAVLNQCPLFSLSAGDDLDRVAEVVCRALSGAAVESAHGHL